MFYRSTKVVLPVTLKYTNKHQTTMHLISVNYTLIWQLDFMPNIQFTVCGKCFNVLNKKGKQLTAVVSGIG